MIKTSHVLKHGVSILQTVLLCDAAQQVAMVLCVMEGFENEWVKRLIIY